MTRNQKIALGCGGAGCLGLIVVVIAGCLIYFLAYRSPRSSYNYNYNVSTNRNSNSNDNSDFSSNSNTNDNNNSNSTNSSNSSSNSASSMSDDDKHRLYQAAIQTGDQELIRRVQVKLGLMDEDYTPGASYQQFINEHVGWAIGNTDFIGTINSPDKARAYVNEHFPE